MTKRRKSSRRFENESLVRHNRQSRLASDTLGSTKAKFTVLIGSRARRTDGCGSDIDIVRIGHKRPVKLHARRTPDTITYVNYDLAKFSDLYQRGSLFIYHVFNEGRLLEGDERTWEELKDNFKVSTNFRREISQNRKFLRWLQRGEKFRDATIPYLAHACRALKNLAIFSLAQRRRYVFDKRAALRRAFPALSDEVIGLLISANNAFERPQRRPPLGHALSSATLRNVRNEIAHALQSAPQHASR
jgi:predicted nucleotidyltransferase